MYAEGYQAGSPEPGLPALLSPGLAEGPHRSSHPGIWWPVPPGRPRRDQQGHTPALTSPAYLSPPERLGPRGAAREAPHPDLPGPPHRPQSPGRFAWLAQSPTATCDWLPREDARSVARLPA